MITGDAHWAPDITVWCSDQSLQGAVQEPPAMGDGWGWTLFEIGFTRQAGRNRLQKGLSQTHIPTEHSVLVLLEVMK